MTHRLENMGGNTIVHVFDKGDTLDVVNGQFIHRYEKDFFEHWSDSEPLVTFELDDHKSAKMLAEKLTGIHGECDPLCPNRV